MAAARDNTIWHLSLCSSRTKPAISTNLGPPVFLDISIYPIVNIIERLLTKVKTAGFVLPVLLFCMLLMDP